ncbi:MAG: hypothetical protein BIFFINMI_00061 [Phycisphaerae bacterium]|nr:hypothetical protein [Phycisphaerae bacterium]
MSRIARPLLSVLLLCLPAALAGGCASAVSMGPDVQSGQVVVTSLKRATDPAEAALLAANDAKARMGNIAARAVIFFECYGEVASSETITGSIRSVFPDADVVGCSAVGVATAEGQTADRGLALAVIGGPAGATSSAYVAAAGQSADEAAGQLSVQLGGAPGERSVVLLLVDPETVTQLGWEPGRLLSKLSGGGDRQAVIVGGLASPRGKYGIARIYHQEHGYAAGAVALRIAGALDWSFDTRQELLPVGPLWTVRQVQDDRISELASPGGVQAAGDVLRRFLTPRELANQACVARLVGRRYVPSRVELPEGGGIRLASPVHTGDRLVVMQPGTAEGRMQAMRAALDSVMLTSVTLQTLPLTLLAVPPGPFDTYAAELDRTWAEVRRQDRRHPLPLLFMTAGQFAPVVDDAGRTVSQYFEQTTACLQFARQQ